MATGPGVRPREASGVARDMYEGARLADHRDKRSSEIGRIAGIVREADHWAKAAGRAITTREDIERAVDEHLQRSDRLRDRSLETFELK